jgi:4,5-DOPA dioxygenase extradiol
MDRRELLRWVLATGAAPFLGGCEARRPMSQTEAHVTDGRMPSVFLAHGSPFLLDDTAWNAELARWAQAMPRPRAVLMISAHWTSAPVALGATTTVPLVYDFSGFPQRYYEVVYPAPGAPALAQRVKELVGPLGPVREDPARGLDHGAYVPLIAMYPDASVPVLQMSIPTMDPASLVALGRALAPLRDEGVLIVGSGFLTHNLRAADWRESSVTPAWASEFDAWAGEALGRRDLDALLGYRERAPGVRMALPSHEHFVPVLVAAGAADEKDPVSFPITGFAHGSFTKRSVQFG